VADDRRAVDPDGREQVADRGRVCAERVVAARASRVAVPDQVGRDHLVAVGQAQGHVLPVARGVHHAVDQHDRRPAADGPVDHPVAVELDLPGIEPGMTMNGGVDPRRVAGRVDRPDSGTGSVDHLVDNIAAANIELADHAVATLDRAASDA
jgi:hypothetical protein